MKHTEVKPAFCREWCTFWRDQGCACDRLSKIFCVKVLPGECVFTKEEADAMRKHK